MPPDSRSVLLARYPSLVVLVVMVALVVLMMLVLEGGKERQKEFQSACLQAASLQLVASAKSS